MKKLAYTSGVRLLTMIIRLFCFAHSRRDQEQMQLYGLWQGDYVVIRKTQLLPDQS